MRFDAANEVEVGLVVEGVLELLICVHKKLAGVAVDRLQGAAAPLQVDQVLLR
jgi:hypothetical protein